MIMVQKTLYYQSFNQFSVTLTDGLAGAKNFMHGRSINNQVN